METINPCRQFLFCLRVNEIPNKTFILESQRPFICSAGLPDVPNVDAAIQGGGGQQEMLQRTPGYIRHRPSHINTSF